MTRFWVAVDHERSGLFAGIEGIDTRGALISDVISSNDHWGVVVPPDLDVAAASIPESRWCVGFPDLRTEAEVEALKMPVAPVPAVKIGFFHMGSHGCDVTAERILSNTQSVTQIFLEPYCIETECLRTLNGLELGPSRVLRLKLGIDAASLSAITCARIEKGWLGRSDGSTWVEFQSQLAAARQAGCAGVMAGRAIWGDLVPVDPTTRQVRLVERMNRIRTVFP